MQIQTLDAHEPPELRTYLGVLWRRRWWIVGVTLLCGLLGFVNAARHEPLYRASGAALLSAPPEVLARLGTEPLSDSAERQIANEIELIDSQEVQARVRELVGRPLAVDVSNAAGSDVIRLVSTDPDPEVAAADVNDFTDAYVQVRSTRNQEDLRTARQEVRADREAQRLALVELRRPIVDLDAQIAATTDPAVITQLAAQRQDTLNRINDDLQAAIDAIDGYDQTLAQLDGLRELDEPGIEVISRATPPTEPFHPQPKKDLLVGLVIGLLLGLAAAFLREVADDRVLTEDDLEKALPDTPVLAVIPELTPHEGEPNVPLVVGAEAGAEAYRSLAASVEFSRLGKPVTVIHVTSAIAGEGKSTTAANLAVAFADTGTRVVAVDADLRRPMLHQMLGVPSQPGLSDHLLRGIDLDEVLVGVEDVPSLSVLPPGPVIANPSKLLYAQRTEDLFGRLRAEFDVVIIDSPPLLPVADSLVLTQFADLIVLVTRSGHTGRRLVRKARKAVGRIESGTLVTVLNRASRSGPDGYDYYYGRYYAAADDEGASS